MRAGRLDKRITIESVSRAKNGIGEDIETWSDFKTVWAGVEYKQGAENLTGGEISGRVTVEILIRWLDGIDPGKNRVNYDGKIFNIISVLPDTGRNRSLKMICVARSD